MTHKIDPESGEMKREIVYNDQELNVGYSTSPAKPIGNFGEDDGLDLAKKVSIKE